MYIFTMYMKKKEMTENGRDYEELCYYMYANFPPLSVLVSEGGGPTQDGLPILCCRGDRLWDDLQRLRLQLHTGLRGHTHDEVRVHVHFASLSALLCYFPFLTVVFLQSMQALGGRRPRSGQSEEPNVSAAHS